MEEDLSSAGLLQKIDAPEQRAFSASAGADQAYNIALIDRKGDVAQNHVVAKALLEMLNAENRGSACVISHWALPPFG